MIIFHDEQDYKVFLHYLRLIFSPLEILQEELRQIQKTQATEPVAKIQIQRLQRAINKSIKYETYKNVRLLSFCLMPTHFHLLLYQTVKDGIEKVMSRLGTGYSMFFKQKYDWVGSVVQGRYSAGLLNYDPKLQPLITANYIEQNPSDLTSVKQIETYPYSSLQFYANQINKGQNPPVWLNTKHLLDIFAEIKSNPNNLLEEEIAQFDNYVDFVLGGVDINPEDVRLMHLNSI